MAETDVDRLARGIEQALGNRLVALLMYGSSARASDAERSGKERVNTLLICDAVDEALFTALETPIRTWTHAGHEAPLILSQQEWRRSSDAFAIEYEEIRDVHRLLAGRDPWDGITVRREDVRRQLESELRGKMVRLRQAYAAFRGDGRRLAEIVQASVPGLLTMFRTLLRLSGKAVPRDAAQLVRDTAAVVGFPAGEAGAIVTQAADRKPLKLEARDARAAAYLDVVARTVAFVDRLT